MISLRGSRSNCGWKRKALIKEALSREEKIIVFSERPDFKNNGTHVLLATTTCGETWLNIPQANVVIIADTSWTPSKQIQAYSRILRPQQTRKPRIYMLRAKGSID
jgi:SNF2 family DNA or RNA helicase